MYISGTTVWYNVKSIERSLAFYTEQLGFELVFHDKEGGMALVKTNTKDCTIGFSEAESVIPSTSSTVFDVENMDKAVETLKQKGVSFIGDIETIPDYGKFATFADPDGNSLMLSEMQGASE